MSKSPPIKQHWLDRAISVRRFHIEQCNTIAGWTIRRTAEALNRSLGSVSEDITLALWTKTHEKQLRKFSTARDAINFLRKKRREINLEE